MATPLTPSKRPLDQEDAELNSKAKLQKSVGNDMLNEPSKSSSDDVVFRILCSASIIDSITRADASFLSQISKETGAGVRVEEVVPGCDERVVVISSPKTEENFKQGKENSVEEPNKNEASNEIKEQEKSDEGKNLDKVENVKFEKITSCAQKALLAVFDRVVESELKTNKVNEENNKSSTSVLRLLVLPNQVARLLEKGGRVIKQMSSESGAQIHILPRDKLPACVSASDELVEITGEIDTIRRALLFASQELLENLPRDHDTCPSNPTVLSSNSADHLFSRHEVFGPPNNSSRSHRVPSIAGRDAADFRPVVSPLKSKFRDGGVPGRMMPSQEVLTFRLLCPDERVGGVIGKGGAIVRTLQQDTGCEIKIMDGFSDSEARIIVISGPAHPDDRISPPQDAVLRVQTRIFRALPDTKDKTVTARLLVSSKEIGCLLGKAGSVIAEMRKVTGAYIRIMGKDQFPKCASEGEEVVQVSGEYEAVQDALIQITTRLRHRFFRDVISYHSINPGFMEQAPPFPPYMGRREFSPPGHYSNHGPPFHKFDTVGGPPPHGGFHPHEDRPPFVHNIHRSGMPPHIPERRPWGPQGFIEGGGQKGFPDFHGAPHRRSSGFGGGSQPAIITSTTVEVVVPRSFIPIIYGEDGVCLQQIRQISDAKVMIADPKPGATETVITISGTPEQTHAAQSLIQAFVMTETDSA